MKALTILHDNNSPILDQIRTQPTIKLMMAQAQVLGLMVSVTYKFDWIAIAEQVDSEDIFIAELYHRNFLFNV